MLIDKDPILRRTLLQGAGRLFAGTVILPNLEPLRILEQTRPQCSPEDEESVDYLIRFTSEVVQLDPDEGDDIANFRIEAMRSDFPNSGRLIYIPRSSALREIVEFPVRHVIRNASMVAVNWLNITRSNTLVVSGAIGKEIAFNPEEYSWFQASRPINVSSLRALNEIGGMRNWFGWRERYTYEQSPPRLDLNWFRGQPGAIVFDGILNTPGAYSIPNCRPSQRA